MAAVQLSDVLRLSCVTLKPQDPCIESILLTGTPHGPFWSASTRRRGAEGTAEEPSARDTDTSRRVQYVWNGVSTRAQWRRGSIDPGDCDDSGLDGEVELREPYACPSIIETSSALKGVESSLRRHTDDLLSSLIMKTARNVSEELFIEGSGEDALKPF